MKIMIDGQEINLPPQGPSGPDGNPLGTVISFMGTSAPTGYLVCDGAEYEISAYPALANFFEQQFGTKNHFGGNGTDTFAVPDFRDRFVLGGGGTHTVGETGGEETHTLTVEEMPEHSHGLQTNPSPYQQTSKVASLVSTENGYRFDFSTEKTGDTVPHNNMPPYYVLCYIIKVTDGGEGGGTSVIESYDTEDGWHVRKWSDGYVEMIYKGTNPSKGSYEAPYTYYTIHNQISLPIVLVERYSENLSLLDSSNTYNPKFPMVYTAGDNEKTSSWGVFIMVKATGVAMNYSLVVTGRWK